MVYLLFFFHFGVFQTNDIITPITPANVSGLITTSPSDTFPDFQLPDQKNQYVELYKMKPRAYTLITLWNSECKNCDVSFKHLHSLHNKYEKKMSFITVSNDRTPSTWKTSIENHQIDGLNLIDKDGLLKAKMKQDANPLFVLLGKNFKILEKFSSIDQLAERLENYYFISDGLNIRNEPQ